MVKREKVLLKARGMRFSGGAKNRLRRGFRIHKAMRYYSRGKA